MKVCLHTDKPSVPMPFQFDEFLDNFNFTLVIKKSFKIQKFHEFLGAFPGKITEQQKIRESLFRLKQKSVWRT